jgi:uncharacterized protein (TIGR04255 family)
MAVALQEPDRTPLREEALALVICQVDFSEIDSRLASKDVFRYRDTLNRGPGGYGELTQVRKNQVTLQLGVFGATSTSDATASKGWRLATRDQSWAVALFPDSVTLESRKYGGWAESFRPRLYDAFAGAIDAFSPEVETRIGLRYVNQFGHDDATSPLYWAAKIEAPFLGPLQDRLGPAVVNSTMRVTFQFEEIQAVVALAFQPDTTRPGHIALVFDIDVSRQGAREFAFNDLMNAADVLNTRALQVFQSIVNRSFLQELR